jgi:hypothetical protein
VLSFIRNLSASFPRSAKPGTGAKQLRARLNLESLEAREVRSNGIGPDHTVADSAADQYERLALQTNVAADIDSYLFKGLQALKAADHPVVGFYKLEYDFVNYAHDYDNAYDCFIPAIANASYWANYDPTVKGSGSDRSYGLYEMHEGDAYYYPRWDGTYAQNWRDYARNQWDLSNTTPLSSTIAGWWRIGTGPGFVYINPVSATQVTLYVYNDGSNYSGALTMDQTDGSYDYGSFYHAENTSLTSAFAFTFDPSDSAHLAARQTTDGSSVDFTLTRYYA